MIQERGFNAGKPTGICPECSATLIRYLGANDVNSYQACPDCEDV